MKVLLRDFIRIVGDSFFLTGLCELLVETKDENDIDCFENVFFQYDSGRTGEVVKSVSHLEPFLDYEIIRLEQRLAWGEIDRQVLYLKEMVKEKEQDISLDDKLSDASIRSLENTNDNGHIEKDSYIKE